MTHEKFPSSDLPDPRAKYPEESDDEFSEREARYEESRRAEPPVEIQVNIRPIEKAPDENAPELNYILNLLVNDESRRLIREIIKGDPWLALGYQEYKRKHAKRAIGEDTPAGTPLGSQAEILTAFLTEVGKTYPRKLRELKKIFDTPLVRE